MSQITVITGRYNALKQVYEPDNTDNWSDLSGQTWASWTSWNSSPSVVEIRLDDDLGVVDVRTPTLTVFYDGEATYELKISDTGTFTGEETTINFVIGTSYSVPAGRYYRWQVLVETGGTGLLPQIRSISTDYNTAVITEYQRSIDTSTLTGDVYGRIVDTNLGTVYSCDITSYEQTAWTDRFYAVPDDYDTPTDIAPIPGIVDVAPLTIVLRNYYGEAVDGVVDITVRGVPKITQTISQGINIQ